MRLVLDIAYQRGCSTRIRVVNIGLTRIRITYIMENMGERSRYVRKGAELGLVRRQNVRDCCILTGRHAYTYVRTECN